MKKIDKLIIGSFIGPFVLTLCVVTFIFLMRLIAQYMPELVGKDISMSDYGKMFAYFSLITIPISLPLAVLLSSLMAFGNLGEFFELIAIKSAGISASRAMRPVFFVVVLITIFSFWFNNKVAPWANLKGYSLLYDIKTAKASLNIKEGIFYNDIPGYNIKVDKKMPDGRSLKNLIIYRHPPNEYDAANRDVTLADSGLMYTINNNSHLVFELFNGNQYSESNPSGTTASTTIGSLVENTQLARNQFAHYKMVVSLESFGMKRTGENQFVYHEFMKDANELRIISDSLHRKYQTTQQSLFATTKQYYNYTSRAELLRQSPATSPKAGKWIDSLLKKKVLTKDDKQTALAAAVSQANNILNYTKSNKLNLIEQEKQWFRYDLEQHHKYSQSLACLVMFLIGAPLGAIIKKGGFGLPVLVSVIFFILSYVFTIQGDKWAKDGIVWVPIGAWLSNTILALVGFYFADRAIKDSRIFDQDVYIIWVEKVKKWWENRRVANA
jgi:lipopolysaccharide export system permease protein